MTDVDIRASVAPKSDQLNADDLIGTTKTITITAVKAGSRDQPVIVHYDGENGRPYKPCKSMRRVMIAAWGDNGSDWVGQAMTLYCDPEVMFGGVKVGGIRISHVSGIKNSIDMSLTATRGKRKPYRVDPLTVATPTEYPADVFAEKLPAMLGAIESGQMTRDKVIAHCEKTGKLSEAQKAQLVVKTETDEEETY